MILQACLGMQAQLVDVVCSAPVWSQGLESQRQGHSSLLYKALRNADVQTLAEQRFDLEKFAGIFTSGGGGPPRWLQGSNGLLADKCASCGGCSPHSRHPGGTPSCDCANFVRMHARVIPIVQRCPRGGLVRRRSSPSRACTLMIAYSPAAAPL